MGCNTESSLNSKEGQVDIGAIKIKLYYATESAPSRAVKSFLDAGNFKYEKCCLDLFKGENKSPEIIKLNPDGKVPFVVINNDIYKESASILRLVSSIVAPLTSYYPQDPFVRQKIDSALDFNGATMRPSFVVFWSHWSRRWTTGEEKFGTQAL